jgi:hypothetical protein
VLALPLNRFELAHAHRDGQSFFVARADLGLICAMPARDRDCLRSDALQRFGNSELVHVARSKSE